MLEVRAIRANPDRLRQAIRLRGIDPLKADVDRWLDLTSSAAASRPTWTPSTPRRRPSQASAALIRDAARQRARSCVPGAVSSKRRSTASPPSGIDHGLVPELAPPEDATRRQRGRERRSLRLDPARVPRHFGARARLTQRPTDAETYLLHADEPDFTLKTYPTSASASASTRSRARRSRARASPT